MSDIEGVDIDRTEISDSAAISTFNAHLWRTAAVRSRNGQMVQSAKGYGTLCPDAPIATCSCMVILRQAGLNGLITGQAVEVHSQMVPKACRRRPSATLDLGPKTALRSWVYRFEARRTITIRRKSDNGGVFYKPLFSSGSSRTVYGRCPAAVRTGEECRAMPVC